MGGLFYCGQCGKDHHSDDGYNAAKLKDGGELFEFCETMYTEVVAAHLNGDRELSELDGKSLLDHFVCPECLMVRPLAENGRLETSCASCRPG